MLVRPEVRSWHQYSFAGLLTLVFAGGAGVGLGQLQWHGERPSSGRGAGRKIKHVLLARERVEQADDFGGRVKAKRADRSMTCCAIRGATASRTPPTSAPAGRC